MRQISFRDFMLRESPVAMIGDWENHSFKPKTPFIAQKGIEKYWLEEGSVDTKRGPLELYKSKSSNTYVAGIKGFLDKKEGLIELIRGSLRPIKEVQKFTKHKSAHQMEKIYVQTDSRFMGVGISFYAYFLDNGFQIVSDSEQYDGARKIYAKLAKFYKIDIYDSESKTIIVKDYNLKHGEDFWEFDEKVYSLEGSSFSKENLLLVIY